jgi:hypothetical protein
MKDYFDGSRDIHTDVAIFLALVKHYSVPENRNRMASSYIEKYIRPFHDTIASNLGTFYLDNVQNLDIRQQVESEQLYFRLGDSFDAVRISDALVQADKHVGEKRLDNESEGSVPYLKNFNEEFQVSRLHRLEYRLEVLGAFQENNTDGGLKVLIQDYIKEINDVKTQTGQDEKTAKDIESREDKLFEEKRNRVHQKNYWRIDT